MRVSRKSKKVNVQELSAENFTSDKWMIPGRGEIYSSSRESHWNLGDSEDLKRNFARRDNELALERREKYFSRRKISESRVVFSKNKA